MATARLFGVLFCGGLAVAGVVAACADPTPPDVGNYGPPNGLQNKPLPLPPSEDASAPSGSSSGTSTGSSSGTQATQYLCETTSGGTIVDTDGGCSVSFTTDIFPKMEASGTWACASSTCHGGIQTPLMTTDTAAAFYAALANYSFSLNGASVPYVNPCSTSPTESGFACNTIATGTAGACTPQMPTTSAIPATDQTTIATWVACGAPLN